MELHVIRGMLSWRKVPHVFCLGVIHLELSANEKALVPEVEMPWCLCDSCTGILGSRSTAIKMLDRWDHVVMPLSNHLGSGTHRGCDQAQHSHWRNTPHSLEDCRRSYVVDVASPMNHMADVLGRQVRLYKYLSIELGLVSPLRYFDLINKSNIHCHIIPSTRYIPNPHHAYRSPQQVSI